MQDYNSERHWAHESRDDGCRSPAEVIGWHKGMLVPGETLNRILFATRYTRYLDRYGYSCLQDWRLYGERGLGHQPVNVWVYPASRRLFSNLRRTLFNFDKGSGLVSDKIASVGQN